MKSIQSIDLWTEQYSNHYECFNGAFIDGFEKSSLPYDSFKIVKNCNCLIKNNMDISIGNKHNAIVFYKNKQPIRLLVAQKETDVDKLVLNALNQTLTDGGGGTLYQKFSSDKMKYFVVDLHEKPIFNEYNSKNEIDVGSCDRFSLMKSMLGGSYTEDMTKFGHFDNDKYLYIKNLEVSYSLETDKEIFDIEHEGAFLNELKTRIIILQKKFSGN